MVYVKHQLWRENRNDDEKEEANNNNNNSSQNNTRKRYRIRCFLRASIDIEIGLRMKSETAYNTIQHESTNSCTLLKLITLIGNIFLALFHYPKTTMEMQWSNRNILFVSKARH